MDEILLFDVNETLLDLEALRPHFVRAFGDGRVMGEWFALLLRHTMVATLTGAYRPFDVLGEDALAMTARRHGVDLGTGDRDAILDQMLHLPAHPDVVPALTRFRRAGFRMATLTNSAPSALSTKLSHAGLSAFFERQFSVDAVKRFKPAPETYRYAADQLGSPIRNIRLIAAHDWDVTGALRAGARAAFVAREGRVLGATGETPDVIGSDLLAIFRKLTA